MVVWEFPIIIIIQLGVGDFFQLCEVVEVMIIHKVI
jgi:hypothetical protein